MVMVRERPDQNPTIIDAGPDRLSYVAPLIIRIDGKDWQEGERMTPPLPADWRSERHYVMKGFRLATKDDKDRFIDDNGRPTSTVKFLNLAGQPELRDPQKIATFDKDQIVSLTNRLSELEALITEKDRIIAEGQTAPEDVEAAAVAAVAEQTAEEQEEGGHDGIGLEGVAPELESAAVAPKSRVGKK